MSIEAYSRFLARIGNSVPPVMAEVLVKANYKPAKEQRKAKAS